MPHQNPYAAPQAENGNDTASSFPLDRAAELEPLIQGARFCHDAFSTVYCTPVILFLLCIPFSSEIVTTYLLAILLLYAAMLHLVGLAKMVNVPLDSYARELFVFALIFFGCSLAVSLGIYAMVWTGQIWEGTIWLSLGNIFVLCCSFTALLWGFYEIGWFVNRTDICRLAKLALGCLALYVLHFLSGPKDYPLWGFLLLCGWLIAAGLGLIFYGMTLRRVMELAPMATLIEDRVAQSTAALEKPQKNDAVSSGEATSSM